MNSGVALTNANRLPFVGWWSGTSGGYSSLVNPSTVLNEYGGIIIEANTAVLIEWSIRVNKTNTLNDQFIPVAVLLRRNDSASTGLLVQRQYLAPEIYFGNDYNPSPSIDANYSATISGSYLYNNTSGSSHTVALWVRSESDGFGGNSSANGSVVQASGALVQAHRVDRLNTVPIT